MTAVNLSEYAEQSERDVSDIHRHIQSVVETNQQRVLTAFQSLQVSDSHFNPTTGYGYDDFGRDTLEALYADVLGGEDALVRMQLVSGTHAITTALFGVLRPGEELLYITGKPYDTLEDVIGTKEGEDRGSLRDFQIGYHAIPLTEAGEVDMSAVKEAMNRDTKVVAIQRSKGYAHRPSFSIAAIESMIAEIKAINSNVIVFVDNCYGEFVETREPLHVGADLIAGSLIKNPGGGIVKTGGYIAGKQKLIDMCSQRHTAPGLGKETGATIHSLPEMFQGFFLAPHVVGEALKGAVFTAKFLAALGFNTEPGYEAERTDLIQSVTFQNAKQMVRFCQAIQYASPINSHVTPYPSPMPGYQHDVIMAAGTFIQGASLELTADGPLRPPYTAYVQGGLTYAHVKLAVMEAAKRMMEES
ncbi:methionine gamma-lyase family protein [Thalassobacillus sp. CUG 92003]|uniref:methionine gamma-lyase family protein n=1 Tax=Thalassobacillus sp. CUG 92003 TaxID=2736641 RepID=UPI0015E7DC52|nr:methionine gamma-lyase family protein [Thalassobacillus sp. CUG 92003]